MPEWFVDGWPPVAFAAAKAGLMYVLALLALRIAARRVVAQWNAIDFAAAVAVGAIIGRTAIAGNQSFAVGAIALVTIVVAHWLANGAKVNGRFRKLMDHRVRILVDHGKLRNDQLRVCGITEDELLAQLRQRGVGSIGELRYVLYESKGELTLVPETGSGEPDPELVRLGLDSAPGATQEHRLQS